jgi:hypothetical protein
MECGFYPGAHHFSHFDGISNKPLFTVNPNSTWTVDLARLRHERDILERMDSPTALHTYMFFERSKREMNDYSM